MKILSIVLACVLFTGATAEAATTTPIDGTFSVTGGGTTNPGFVVDTNAGALGGGLQAGTNPVVPLFDIWMSGAGTGGNARVAQSLDLTFNLSQLAPALGSGSLIVGRGFFMRSGLLRWGQPLTFQLPNGAGTVAIVLSDVIFTWGVLSGGAGLGFGATIFGSLTFTPQVSPVPLPGALVLLLGGLAALGFAGFRNRTRQVVVA